MKKIAALLCACLILGGCSSQNPYEKELDPKNPITLTLSLIHISEPTRH